MKLFFHYRDCCSRLGYVCMHAFVHERERKCVHTQKTLCEGESCHLGGKQEGEGAVAFGESYQEALGSE
jgi:hypothetical protein